MMWQPSAQIDLSAETPRVRELLQMLTYRRPSGSATERQFIARYITPLGTQPDTCGNHWLKIGNSPILWSSHTDTVHIQGGRQRVLFADGCAWTVKSNCLGADCTAGVWIMRQLALAGMPGTYIFHSAEELGGLGSDFIARTHTERLRDIDFAIAFDRRGTGDVITHQMGGRTASEAFAWSLARALYPLPYAPEIGIFTDTANYSHLIPECSNLSVGYEREHSRGEWLDVQHCEALLTQLLLADFTRLVRARDPVREELRIWHDLGAKP